MSSTISRAEKIGKLSRAAKEWRGARSVSGKWIRVPKPAAAKRVSRWAEELGLNADETMQIIGNFTTYNDFYSWLRKLY